MKLFVLFLIFTLFTNLSCSENPLGDSSTESSISPDTEAPTTPSSLIFSGAATLVDSPSLSWTHATDNDAVISYEIGLGSTSGGTEISDFSNIGFVTTYQYTDLSPSLTAATQYFISIRSIDKSGNKSSITTIPYYSQGLEIYSSAYRYPGGSFAINCLGYLNSTQYNSESDGIYWIDPDGAGVNPELKVRCDMSRDGGGWTLIANRRIQGSNIETCQSNLDGFFQNSCGTPTNISSSDSYSIGNTAIRENILSNNEWLFVSYDGTDTEDSDDAFIIHHNSDLFFSSTGTLNRTIVSQVCDINNQNCDTTNVEFLWAGDGYFSSALCSSGYTASGGTYFGNYGYCHNGPVGNANSLFGNRDAYVETKLWGHPSGGGNYYERIFIR